MEKGCTTSQAIMANKTIYLFDLKSCPGSVMFLFRLNKLKKYILHTGDFRASDELITDNLLKNIKIDIVYLDTT